MLGVVVEEPERRQWLTMFELAFVFTQRPMPSSVDHGWPIPPEVDLWGLQRNLMTIGSTRSACSKYSHLYGTFRALHIGSASETE